MAQQQQEERYEIKGKVGEGGRGAVYRAFDRQLNRNVAIKRLFPDSRDAKNSEGSHEAVMKESHALSAINSPHIVRVFDVATDEDGPYVVMEYLDGKTLHDVVSRAPLVLEDFLVVAEQALEALISAHDAKLLHRDIKPGNLMLTWLPSGRIQLKLLDFGLAKFTEKPAVQTIAQKGSVLGSIYFMAPEQFERTPLDPRTDLYSLGCVLYHSLTGKYPFDGETVTEVMAAHIQGDCAELQPLRPDLSPALCRWVMRLIARDMDARPADAQEALREFEVAKRATAPVHAKPVPSGPRLLTGPGADTSTHAIPTGAPSTRTLLTTTNQVPLHTTSTTTVGTGPHTRFVKPRNTTVPPWVFMIGGVLLLSIVALGVAMAMRGDPGKVDPPQPAYPEGRAGMGPRSAAATPPPAPVASPKPAPAPTPARKPPAQKPSLAQEFRRQDRNNDFVLSEEEFVTARDNPRRAQLEKEFAKLDKNRDGALTMSEFKNRSGGSK